MSQQIPTTSELNTQIISQLEASFGQTIPLLPKSFARVLSKVLAAVLVIAYKYAGYIFLQQFVQYAGTTETTINGKTLIPLVEWGRLVGVGDPTAATRASYVVTITVTNPTGTLPANTQLFNATNGVTYLTLAQVDLTDPAPVQVTIRAYNDQNGTGGRGSIGDLNVGDTVSFINPLANVASDTVVASEVAAGVDAEDWEVYRGRVTDRFRSQPQGGAYTDYKGWALLVTDIINAYVYTGDPGVVEVYTETTATALNPDGIPSSTQLDAVKASIEYEDSGLASRRPVNAYVNSNAITRTGFNVQVVGLIVPGDVTLVNTQLATALTQYFSTREPYVSGLSLGARKDRLTHAAVAGVVQDVVNAFGGVYSGVSFYVTAGAELDIYVLDEGEKAKLESLAVTS